jgi:hypothetical protein
MFSALNAFTTIGIILSGTHIYLINAFPVAYKSFLIKSTFLCIYAYTKVEHSIIKFTNYLKRNKYIQIVGKFIEENFNSKRGDIDIIKFNTTIINTTKEQLETSQPILYDFLIYSCKNSETNLVDKVVFFDIPTNFNYSPCTYSFISSQIQVNDTIYQIKFLNEKDNYLIVNNKINRLLVVHILKQQFGVIYDEIMIKYKLDIIDNQVNMLSLDESQELTLEENKLSISNYEYIER